MSKYFKMDHYAGFSYNIINCKPIRPANAWFIVHTFCKAIELEWSLFFSLKKVLSHQALLL